MKINKLEIKNFKKFINKTIEFNDGLNILLGKNEAGKSTLVDALLVVLYDNPESKASNLKKYYSWNNDKGFILSLEFEVEKEKYLLTKDFIKHEAILTLPNGKTLTNIDLINDYLFNQIKLPPKSVYQNSGFIKQDEIIKLDYGGEFKNAIQNLVVEGDEKVDVSNIQKNLDKRITLLNKGSKGNSIKPGPIKALIDKIYLKEKEISAGKEKLEFMQSSNSRLKKINEELIPLRDKLENGKRFIAKIKSIFTIDSQLKELNKKYDEVENIESEIKDNRNLIKEKQEVIKEEYNEFLKIENPDALEAEINSLLAKEEVLSKVTFEEKKNNSPLIISILIIALLTIILFVSTQNALTLLLGLVLAVVAYFYFKKNSSPKNKKDDNLLIETNNKLADFCSTFNTKNIDELLNKLKQFKKEIVIVKDLEKKEEILLRKTSLEEIIQNKKTILKEISKLEEKLEEINSQGKKYSDAEISNYEFELEKINTKIVGLEKEGYTLNAKIESSEISQEEINLMLEEMEEDKATLKKYQEELIVLKLVKDSIENSYMGTVKDSKTVIEDIVNKNISFATNNRYSKIILTDDFDLKVFSQEKGDYVSCQELSKGTIDQIYLLTRLSFAECLTEGQKMPFILDDPFVNFDSQRLNNFKEILIKYCQDYQMILFSHNEIYSDWGSAVLIDRN